VALAAVSGAVAQVHGFDAITAPLTPGTNIKAGSTFTITWEPSAPAGKISIVLLQGSSNVTLEAGDTIAKSIDSTDGKFDWKVPSTGVSFPAYGFKLQLDADPATFQYSTFFSISGLDSGSGTVTSTTVVKSTTSVAKATVTVKVSSLPGVKAPAPTTTVLPTLITSVVHKNSTTTTHHHSSTVGFKNTTSSSTSAKTTHQSTVTATTAITTGAQTSTGTTSAATTAATGGAMSNVSFGGTTILGALMLSLSMLL